MTEATRKAMFSTGKDDWETPQWIFDQLDKEFHFTLDPCCTHETAKCEKHYTQEEDGLAQSWEGETVFVNPPYSKKTKDKPGQIDWVKKCYEEGQKPGTTVVALLPSRTDTKQFHKYIWWKCEVRFLEGRISFLDNGKAAGKPTFGSMVCIWRG